MRHVFFEHVESEKTDGFAVDTLLFRFVAHVMQSAQDVLPHGHIRKQRIVLEQITDLPLLRREVDVLFRIEQRASVQYDPAAIRALDARDAFQRQALSASGSAQNAGNAVLNLKIRFQVKCAVCLFDVDDQTHLRFPFPFLRSRRLTASRTTAEIARLIMTQKNAPCSSFVRQS